MEISGWSPVDEIDEVQKVKHAVRMLSTPHSVKQRVILMDYCRQAQLQPTSLDCISQVSGFGIILFHAVLKIYQNK